MWQTISNSRISRHIAAAFVAVLITGCGYFAVVEAHVAPPVYGLYLSDLNPGHYGRGAAATQNYARISNMLRTGHGVIVFGSSELSDKEIQFTPYNFFPQACHIPVIAYGHAHYQSLGMFGLLASLDSDLNRNSKIVILVSPEWFDKGNMLPQAFSEHLNDEILLRDYWHNQSQNILREYLRTHVRDFKKLTEVQKIYISGVKNPSQYAYLASTSAQADIYFARMKFLSYFDSDLPPPYVIDSGYQCTLQAMKSYEPAAKAKEFSLMTDNKRYVRNEYFDKYLTKLPPDGEDYFQPNMVDEPELSDMTHLLTLLNRHNVRPLVIMLPLNTYVYRDARRIDPISEKLGAICKKYAAEYIDMGSGRYIPGTLMDPVHPGELGFLQIDEMIFKYFGFHS